MQTEQCQTKEEILRLADYYDAHGVWREDEVCFFWLVSAGTACVVAHKRARTTCQKHFTKRCAIPPAHNAADRVHVRSLRGTWLA